MDSNANSVGSGTSTTSIDINLCSINICGMSDRSKFTLDKFCYDKSIDILAIQESCTVNKNNQNLKFMNTVSDTNDSHNRGAMLCVNQKKLQVIPLNQISQLSNNIDTAWGLVCGKSFRYIVGSVYLKLNYKNAVNDLMKMLDEAKCIASRMKAKGVIAIGDFNARNQLWDTQENSYGKQLVEQLNFKEYSILNSEDATFLSSNGSSNIDFLIVSNPIEHLCSNITTDPGVELFSGAPIRGHVPIMTKLNIKLSGQPKPPPKIVIDIDTIKWNAWKDQIEVTLGNQMKAMTSLSAHDQWEIIDTTIHDATIAFTQKKKISIHSKPYWTDKLSIAAKELRYAKKNYMKRNTPSNKTILDEAKEKFDTMRKNACQNFILEKTKNLNSLQAQKFWKQFNQLFKKKKEDGVEPFISEQGDIITDSSEIEATLFDSFFAGKHLREKGTDFDDTFYNEVNRIYEEILESEENVHYSDNTNNNHNGMNADITMAEVIYFIKHYDTGGKSLDNHEFHPLMLKNLGENAVNCIVNLYNTCLSTGEWVWDTADVIFFKKEGKKDYHKAGSYRPISITSYIGKVFEQIIASRIETHLKNYGLHDIKQEGFTKKRNTNRYLNRLDNDVRKHLEKKYTVICLFIDFEKAFDSVWKKGLMKKLADAGIQGNIWKLINSFLFNRKVRLVFNDFIGLVRSCREFGLPQGSALSPILFKFYIHDIAVDLCDRIDIELFKFADDGTVRVFGITTTLCLNTLRLVCDSLHKWSSTWRMIINCEPSKTELICFGTAENDPTLIPTTFMLGKNELRFVEKTKVLGLTMDKSLKYIEHGKDIKNRILGRWSTICKYTNRNWGFRQHVIVRLVEVLIATCVHYAGVVWINNRSIREIESTWYRMLKAATGAVFNVKLSLAEIILGVLPITVSNRTNSVKHYLKLNIFPTTEDPLKLLINEQLESTSYNKLTNNMKEVFQFLQWKTQKQPDSFTENDLYIIGNNYLEKYFELSPLSCVYTKQLIKVYSESVWQTLVNSQHQLEGYSDAPIVSSTKLKLQSNLSRESETLLLSLFYPNNLLNSFLYQYNKDRFTSPACCCGSKEQTAEHILLHCQNVKEWKRHKMMEILADDPPGSTDKNSGCMFLISWSRLPVFIIICTEIIKDASSFLHTEITL